MALIRPLKEEPKEEKKDEAKKDDKAKDEKKEIKKEVKPSLKPGDPKVKVILASGKMASWYSSVSQIRKPLMVEYLKPC